MCEFRCDICVAAGGFVTVKYEEWVAHLLSFGHQVEGKNRLMPRKKWRNEEDSFVLTGLVKTNGPPWPLADLLEWLASFGVVTQFLYYENYYFCIFTLQGMGKIGQKRAQSIANQSKFRDHSILIRPKNKYGPLEWNLVYDTIDKDRREAQISISSGGESVGSSTVKLSQGKNDPVPAQATSTSNVTKVTRVFTNTNQQSSNKKFQHQQSPKSANSNNNYSATESSRESINKGSTSNLQQSAKSSPSAATGMARQEQNQQNKKTSNDPNAAAQDDTPGKKKRKSKDKKKDKTTLQDGASTPGTPEVNASRASKETTPRRASTSSSSGIMVPPSSLIPQDASMKSNGNTPVNQKKPQQQEPLNFRGGFGKRNHEYKVSESSDGGYQPEVVAPVASTSASAKPSQQVQQVLQRTVTNDLAGAGGGYKNQKPRQNGMPHSQPNYSKRSQGYGNQPTGRASHLPPNSSSYQRPSHDPRPYQQQQKQHYLLTPIFSCQVDPDIASTLSNPAIPTSRNPYKFDNMPPFPYFFDLFQKLPDESFKPQKEMLFKQFQALGLAEQLEEFFLAQSLPFEEVRLRWQVILDILFLLRQQFPRCELYAFGSILTGLGDFMSDIDIYVDLAGESNSTHPIDPSQKMSGHQAVDTVKKIIRRSLCPHTKSRFVKHMIPVKSARVPILKLTHTTTLINCDLSFENRLSVQNTKMLSFYLNLDKRILRFMVLIRYWAKFHHLTGSNHIKNYALTLLVLVYLTRKGYVPPVELLQRLKAKERKSQRIKNPDEIDGWDSSFCDSVSVIKQNFQTVPLPTPDNSNNNINYITQAQTLIKMTIEFFEMYANLDFSKVVVCPLLGDLLPRENFCPGSEESLPDTLDRYKNWAVKQPLNRRLNVSTTLCVQDPFVLSFNVGSVTPHGTLLRFQIACAKGLQILRQKNGLNSFLDVLLRLPPHIGEKKFMKTFKTERRGQEMKREIKTAALGEASASEPDEQASLPQTSSYVKLPEHLKSFDKLMEEKGLKQMAKKPRWEVYLDFSLGSQFEDTFVAELTRCRIQHNKRSNLMDSLCTLWYQFTLDFLKEFFESGLKLKLLENKESSVEPYYDTETNGADGGKATGDDDGKRKRWKIKMLSKQEEEKLLAQTETFASRSPENIEKVTQQISQLQTPPGVIHYNVITYQATYPFWERRPMLLDKVVKEIKACDMVQIPILPTSRKSKKDKGKGRKGKNEKDGGKVGDGKSQSWNSFNPVDLEVKVSEILTESFSKNKAERKDFTEFQFNVLVKLDMSSVVDRPEIFFLFEKDPSSKCNSNDYFRGMQCLSNILTEAFPRYQVYRLARWLNMPSPEVASIEPRNSEPANNESTENAPGKVKDVEQKIPSGVSGSSDGGESGEKKKKSQRTKLEEDLLIPSSSSSSSSDDENEDLDLEDVSNEEEDDSNIDTNDEDEQSEEEGEEGEQQEKNNTGAI